MSNIGCFEKQKRRQYLEFLSMNGLKDKLLANFD